MEVQPDTAPGPSGEQPETIPQQPIWYKLNSRPGSVFNSKQKRQILRLLEGGETSTAVVADQLNVAEERVQRYFTRLRRKLDVVQPKNEEPNLDNWIKICKKEVSRRIGACPSSLYELFKLLCEAKADTIPPEVPHGMSMAALLRFMGNSLIEEPSMSSEALDYASCYLSKRLVSRIGIFPFKKQLAQFFAEKGTELSQLKIQDETERTFWTGQGRPPPRYNPEAYTLTTPEHEAMSMKGGQAMRAAVMMNPLYVPSAFSKKAKNHCLECSLPINQRLRRIERRHQIRRQRAIDSQTASEAGPSEPTPGPSSMNYS